MPEQKNRERQESTQLVPASQQKTNGNTPKKKEKPKKPTRKERKELAKQQAAYEKQLVKEGKIAPRYHYVPRNTFARILCVCLAFVFGFFGAFGLLIGFGSAAKLKDVSRITGFDYSAVFTETAADMTAIDLIAEIVGKFQNGEMDTLQSFAAYTPLVDTLLDATNGQLSDMGMGFDKAELMNVKLSDIGSWFQENVMENITLADFIGIDEESEDMFLRAICFRKTENGETERITIKEFTNDSASILGAVETEALLGTDGNSEAALRYISYGSEFDSYGNVRYTVETDGTVTMVEPNKKRTLGDLTAEDADLIGGAVLGDLITVDDSSSEILKAIQSWTIDELSQQTRIERLKIGQIVSDTQSSNLMKAVSEWRIADLSDTDKINTLTLKDVLVIDADSPKILVSLSNTRLGDFGDAVDTLRLSDILDEEDLESNKILRNLKDSTLLSLSEDLSAVSVEAVFGEEMYSYLDIDQSGGTFAQLTANYESAYRFSEEDSKKIPVAVDLDGDSVVTVYKCDGEVVTPAYFNGNEPVTENVYKAARKTDDGTELYDYVELKTPVTPVYEWLAYDYETGTAYPPEEEISEDAILEDAFSYYYYKQSADGRVRVDLEKVLTGYEGYGELGGMGDILIDGQAHRVYAENGEFYILLRTEVSAGFVTADGAKAAGEVTAHYYRSSDTSCEHELDRYLSGVWYLLFGGEEELYNMNVAVLDINTTITDAATAINTTPLWELYLHGLIMVNPFKPLGADKNLNELTITGLIEYVLSL